MIRYFLKSEPQTSTPLSLLMTWITTRFTNFTKYQFLYFRVLLINLNLFRFFLRRKLISPLDPRERFKINKLLFTTPSLSILFFSLKNESRSVGNVKGYNLCYSGKFEKKFILEGLKLISVINYTNFGWTLISIYPRKYFFLFWARVPWSKGSFEQRDSSIQQILVLNFVNLLAKISILIIFVCSQYYYLSFKYLTNLFRSKFRPIFLLPL